MDNIKNSHLHINLLILGEIRYTVVSCQFIQKEKNWKL